MKNFKTFFVPAIVLGLIVAGVFYMMNCANFVKERNALAREIDTYYEKQCPEAASLSLKLARPYLSDEDYGRYSQSIDMLDEYYRRPKFLFDSPEDSYVSVMARLGFEEFDHWASQKLYREGGISAANDREARWELVKETPKEAVIEMHQSLQFIGLIRLRFNDDDFDEEALAKTRKDFVDKKARFEAAFTKANQPG